MVLEIERRRDWKAKAYGYDYKGSEFTEPFYRVDPVDRPCGNDQAVGPGQGDRSPVSDGTGAQRLSGTGFKDTKIPIGQCATASVILA